MATTDINITVESYIHNALNELATIIWTKHDLLITNVSFEWSIARRITNEKEASLVSINVTTES